MNTRFDVVGLGTVLVDHQMVVDAYPKPDTKTQVVCHRQQIGGPVPTALVLLSRFGKRCSFIGKWGRDEFGARIAQDLSAEMVTIDDCVQQQNGTTGLAHVWIDQTTGSRTIVYSRGELTPLIAADVSREPLSLCKVLHLDGWSGDAAIEAARIVSASGGKVFLDAGSPKPGMERLLEYVDVVSCPERFVSQFAPTMKSKDDESASKVLMQMGARTVVFTKGDRGAILFDQQQRCVQAAFDVVAVDTTGAGDVFSGAFVYGLLNHWPNKQTIQFAAAAAALKCTGMGNRDALPSEAAIQQLIAATT